MAIPTYKTERVNYSALKDRASASGVFQMEDLLRFLS
jgi:hypothetical protein